MSRRVKRASRPALNPGPAEDPPLLVAFGAGQDSTGMLIEMARRGIRPDLILFADTGGEKPETYAHVIRFNEWIMAHGWDSLHVVHAVDRHGRAKTLEEERLRLSQLPSLAFGGHSCSIRFKTDQQDKYVNHWPRARRVWAAGGKCVKAIGFDASETRRTFRVKPDDPKYLYWYPLIDWGMTRADCVRLVREEGLPVPPKSSCFFCPAMKKGEILDLRDRHPELLDRAVELERRWLESSHEKKSTRGLGRTFAWRDYLAAAAESERNRWIWQRTTTEPGAPAPLSRVDMTTDPGGALTVRAKSMERAGTG